MRPYLLVATATLLSTGLAARADTITQDFNTGSFVTSAFKPVVVNQFNPSLGVLNSISVTYGGSYTVITSGKAELQTYLDEGKLQIVSNDAGPVYADGTYSVSASGTDSTANDLAYLTGSGQSNLTFVALDSGDGFGDSLEYSAGFNGALTYNYTPSVAQTPEPSSIALLGTGLLGVAGMAPRKRFRLARRFRGQGL